MQDEWVVSRVFHKNTEVRKASIPVLLRMNSIGDDLLDFSSLPPLMDPPTYVHTTKPSAHGENDLNCTNLPSSSSSKPPSSGYYNPSFFINNNQHQNLLMKPEDQKTLYEIPTNYNYAANQGNLMSNNSPIMGSTVSHQPQIRIQNPSSTFQQNMFSDYYNMHQGENNDDAFLRAFATKKEIMSGLNKQCKMEQFSSNNQSVVSVDTCLSNDRNTDTSSVVSKHDIGRNGALYNEDLEGPSSVAPLSDLECLWDDY